MIAAAEESGVKLMVAYRLHFDPANMEAAELVRVRERSGSLASSPPGSATR